MKRETMQEPAALQKRPQPGRTRAIVLAIIVHALFFALIVFGVRWQSMPTVPVAAELWDKIPATKKAAAPPPETKPAPKPEPAPPPRPQYAPVPKPPEPPKTDFGPSKPPAVTPDAQIAEKAKREKEQREEQERLEKQRQQEAAKKAEEEAAKKKAQEEAAKKKRAQEEAAKKRAQEEAARKKREEEEKRLAEQIAKAEAADRARQAAATARQMEIQSWVDKIKAKILNRAIVPDTVPTGTEVTVEIHILPGGDVLDIAVTRSTSPTYSAAIERAIRSASPLPVPNANSDLFPEFRDLNLKFRHER